MPYGIGENSSISTFCNWSGAETPCMWLRILNLKESKFINILSTAARATHDNLQKYLPQGILFDKISNLLS